MKPKGGGEFIKSSHTSPDGTLPYRLFIPVEYDTSRRYPLILWLHGAGGSGHDNEGQIAGDQIPGTHTWTTPEQQKKNPAFVLVPQSENGWSYGSGTMTPTLTLVLQVLDMVSADYPIDPNRIYLLGQSMGGGAVWSLITTQPERFAAVALVCPMIREPERVAKAARLPIWIFIGDRDGLATPVRDLTAALRKAGGSPRYTEYEGAGHDIWTRVFKEPELVPWLFAQSR